MANSKLLNTYYTIPDNIISDISKALESCKDGYPGKKKAQFLMKEKQLSYENLKRYKNFFDNHNRSNYNIEIDDDELNELDRQLDYKLRGGNLMRDFVNSKLKEITDKIKNEKKIKTEYAGLSNQYNKESEHNNLKINTDSNFIREEVNIDNEVDEIERTIEDENINVKPKVLIDLFKNSKEVKLKDDIWSKLENTDSNELKKDDWKYVFGVAKKYGKTNPNKLKKSLEDNTYERPLIIKYNDRYILVAGNTRLTTAKAMGINPNVVIADVNLILNESIIRETKSESNKMLKVSLIIIFNDDNKILLLKRSENTNWCPNCWALVGGKIERGEAPEDGLVREVFEETKIKIKKYKLKKIIKEDNNLQYLYLTKVYNDDVTLNSEHTKYKWYSIEEIKKLNNIVPELINYIKYVIL